MDAWEFICYQEIAFDSYCKRLVKNEYRNALKEIMRREKYEVTFSALSDIEIMRFSCFDRYDVEHTVFQIAQEYVTVHDGMLAKALAALPNCWRNIVLMFYFMHQTDRQIGRVLGLTIDATYYRRKSSIRKMKKLMEGYDYET